MRDLLRGANIDDEADAARIVEEAGYWAHQLRYVLAAHAATAVPVGDIGTHGMGLVHFPTTLTASQLQAKLPELEWQSAGTMTA